MSLFLTTVDPLKLDKFRAVNKKHMKCYDYAIIMIMQANINLCWARKDV